MEIKVTDADEFYDHLPQIEADMDAFYAAEAAAEAEADTQHGGGSTYYKRPVRRVPRNWTGD